VTNVQEARVFIAVQGVDNEGIRVNQVCEPKFV